VVNKVYNCPNHGCGGKIIEEERLVSTDDDMLCEGIVCICNKCGEDFTDEIYG